MRKLKITSLILVVVMLLSMIPMGIFSTSAAAVEKPTTVPGGSLDTYWSYKATNVLNKATAITAANAANSVSSALAYKWRGAAGFLLQIDTTAASKLFLQAPMSYGSFGWASYMRITMAQSHQGCNKDNVGGLESDAYIYDGTSWTKQTTNNWGDNYIDLPANFNGYVYVPFDQFYWQGNGNNGNVNGGTTPMKGATAEEFLVHFETPALSQVNVWTDKANTMTVNTTDIIYADKDLAPKDGDIKEAYEWTSISDSADGSTRTQVTNGDSATYTITKGDGKPGVGVFAAGVDSHFDLSEVQGLSIHVDTTGLQGGKQMQFRPYLQYDGGFSDTPYRDNMIINATGNENNTATYTSFYNKHYGDESYCQFVTRTPGSVVYLREDGSSEWEVLFNYCSGAGIDSWGGFLLPAGFSGEIYIPMSSYWFCNLNNGGPIIIPFEKSLVKDIKSIGLFNSMNAAAVAGETNTVVYSDYSVWYDASYNRVEIGTADELVDFFNNLNNYKNKTVVLTNDIVLNAGWDASTGTAPVGEGAVKLANRTAANAYFEGTFDGQNHVISGLYLESDLNALGLFGNVKHFTQATVKNVTIVNSLINQTCKGGSINVHMTGLTAAVGSIFGQVMGEVTEVGTWISDPNYTNQTKATVYNVYSDVDIITTATGGNGMTGYGGIIGVLQSDAMIQQTTYAGSLSAHYRGTAGFVGAIYPVQPQNVDHDFDGATQAFTIVTGQDPDTGADITKTVYYKNNDATAAVVGTANIGSLNANHCNLEIYDSIFSGSVSNDTCGFVAGVLGYNNVCQSSMTLGHVYITGSITNTSTSAKYHGFIQGGSWAAPNADRVATHGKEYQEYRIFDVTAYDVADDTAVAAFGKTSDALKVWYNDINIDWNADGKYSNAEQKYKNALADINKCIYVATEDELMPVLNLRDGYAARHELTVENDFSFTVKLPVGSVVMAPGVDINEVAKVQVNGANYAGATLTLSDDRAYYEATVSNLLPQEADKSLRILVSLTKFDANATLHALTQHDKADNATLGTSAPTIASYLMQIAGDDAMTAEAQDLAADTLRYINATRAFHGLSQYKLDAYADLGAEVVAQDVVDMAGESLEIDSDVHAFQQLAFRLDTQLGVQVFVNADGAYTAQIDGEDATVTAGDGYIVIDIAPTNLWSDLTVVDPINSATLSYNLHDYFAWALDDTVEMSDRQRTVVTALYAYCTSAIAYVDSL